MTSMNDLFYSKDSIEKSKRLNELLEEVEKNNIDFFKDRTSKFTIGRPHAKLNEYYHIIESNGKIQMTVDDQLPTWIQIECLEAFDKVYAK